MEKRLWKKKRVLFYLIRVLRKGNQAQFGLFSEIFCLYPPKSLFMACKRKYNLCMNLESLDRE